MRRPLSDLVGVFSGKGAALVVGGGMRALADLEELRGQQFAAVFAANDHAFRLPLQQPVDFIVCKDDKHTETGERMQKRLKIHETPIVTRHWWGDYRALDWNIQGNSGLMAIALAVTLGCNPIYPIGFDFYQEGTYWYDPNAHNVSRGRNHADTRHKAEVIRRGAQGVDILAPSGPLRHICKTKDPLVGAEPELVVVNRKVKGLYVEAVHPFGLPFAQSVLVPRGERIWVSEREYKNTRVLHNVQVLDRTT